jgi:F-type H+-transporting ATPase subunit gamma
MANLKEIRNRIASVSSTMQITSAMKMVSAAKLKKAQDAITAMRPYANKLTELLQNLSEALEVEGGNVYAEQREVKKVLIVAISSNRGLAGAFNSNIVKECRSMMSEQYNDKKVEFFTIGKKANDILKKQETVVEHNTEIFDDLNFENNAEIAQKLMQYYSSGNYDKIILTYNKFKNAATQIVTTEQFLPIMPPSSSNEKSGIADYIFEPSKAEIVEELIPKSLKTQLFKAIRDSVASEHYNKARQAAITGEILEIVGGAEALAG